MNILVCISNVPDTTSKINFTDSDSKFDKNGVQFMAKLGKKEEFQSLPYLPFVKELTCTV